MIKLNFQPLGMEAEYLWDEKVAKIVVTRCSLHEKFIQDPEFLSRVYTLEAHAPLLEGFGSGLRVRGEWPPKSVEVCALCRIVTPKIGEKMGFTWEHDFTDDVPPRCTFTIRVGPKK